jgi:hypothetical protein
MSKMNNIITRKELSKLAHAFIAEQEKKFHKSELVNFLLKEIEAKGAGILVCEFVEDTAASAIKSRRKPKASSTSDWIGYGDILIALPDDFEINGRAATSDQLQIRAKNVLDNLQVQQQAAAFELARVSLIQKTMKERGLKIVGEALQYLEASGARIAL